jgi:peptide deformylase
MKQLEILEFPDPRLRRRAEPVDQVDDELRETIDAMFETMYAAPGIGLAATQVNVTRRFMVIDVSENKDEQLVFINPEIVWSDGHQIMEEGCLSVPGIFAEVERAERIRVKAMDRDGEAFEMDADGLLATCIQHEIDHLDGKLFVDYLTPLKRQKVKRLLEKQRRQGTQPEPARRAI